MTIVFIAESFIKYLIIRLFLKFSEIRLRDYLLTNSIPEELLHFFRYFFRVHLILRGNNYLFFWNFDYFIKRLAD